MDNLLTVDAIAASLKATSKKQALQEIARLAAPAIGQDERLVFDVLLQRERLGTTGVGHGVAIPHGKIAGVPGVCGFFAKLCRPVDFDAVDDEPVDLIFALFAPEGAGADHLKSLARISRLLRDGALRTRLRGCETPDAIFSLLNDYETEHAA